MFPHSKNTMAVPPGATIGEQLEYRNISQKEFAARMGMSEKHISRLIHGKVELTTEAALRLEYVLGIPAEFWNRMEADYRTNLARVKEEREIEEDENKLSLFPYKEMVALGWLPEAWKRSDKVIHLRSFFEVARLDSLDKLSVPGIAYQAKGKGTKKDYVFAAWAQMARLEARKQDVNAVDLEKLESKLSEIKKIITQIDFFNEDSLVPLREILAECGVVLICLPAIGNVDIFGAVFLDSRHIVLALIENMEPEMFRYSFFHEVGHILGKHIYSMENVTEEQERQVDAFAREILSL